MISKGECFLLALSLIAIILLIPGDIYADDPYEEAILEFSLVSPSSGEYTAGPLVGITVLLEGRKGDDYGTTIQHRTSTSGEGNFTDWIDDANFENSGQQYISVRVFLQEGKGNRIQFRLQNDNLTKVLSEEFPIWVDYGSPTYRLKNPSDTDMYHLNPMQNIQVQIDDAGSGVDADTIMYRLTTTGTENFSSWIPYKDA